MEERDVAHEPTLPVVEDEPFKPVDLYHGEPAHARDTAKPIATRLPTKALTVQNSRELFSPPPRNRIHIGLDLSDQPELHYKTGDYLAVWPTNPGIEVERLLRILGLADGRNIPISIKSVDPAVKVRVPTPTTPGALFRYYLEICSPIPHDSIFGLAQFAPNPTVKTYLTVSIRDKISLFRLSQQEPTKHRPSP